MEPITYMPIGVVHTPFKDREGMPIQPAGGHGVRGHIDISPVHGEGLKDLVGFSENLLQFKSACSDNLT